MKHQVHYQMTLSAPPAELSVGEQISQESYGILS